MANAMAISHNNHSVIRRADFEKPTEQQLEQRRGLFENRLSPEELAKNKNLADEVNKSLRSRGKKYGEAMGKDEFMKLLVTELRHQDPTQPMADREFIAQMTQFSSLEQMQNMNNNMSSLNMKARYGEAYAMIGKQIEAFNPLTNSKTEGEVTHVIRSKDDVRLVVNGNQVAIDDVHAVYAKQNSGDIQHAKSSSSDDVNKNSINEQANLPSADQVHRAHASRAYSAHDGVSAQHESPQSMNQE